MIKLVLFDLDGTLIHSLPDLVIQSGIILKEEGRRTLNEKEVSQMVGDGVTEFLKRAFAATGEALTNKQLEEIVPRYIDYYSKAEMENTHLYDGVLETLDLLKKQGYKIALCTNKPIEATNYIIKKLKIFDFFDLVLGAESCKKRKPDPMPLLFAIEKLKAQKSFMIGDSPPDAEAAKAAKIPFIATTYGYSKIPYDKLGADYLIDNFKKLPQALEKCDLK